MAAGAKPALLMAENVSLAFPSRGNRVPVRALTGVSCTLNPGDRTAIFGDNGSGKTTLLKSFAGIYEPTAGAIRVRGQILALFDYTLGLHHDATGWENAVMLAMLHGRSRREIEAEKSVIVEFAGLGEAIDRPCRGWSHGMMLRLAFGVATAWPAAILLLDEVLAVADAGFVSRARKRLLALANGSAIVAFASHDLGFIRSLANRALILDRGRVVFDGDVEKGIALYEKTTAEIEWNP